MAVAGKIMPRPMGDYDPATIYDILDIVTYDERPWLCKKKGTQGVAPTVTNTTNWMMLFDVDVTNADTLDGFDSSYFAPKTSVDALSTVREGTFLKGGWTGSAAPFTQTISVQGITAADTPTPGLVDNSANAAISKTMQKEYGYISFFDSGSGTITATCRYNKPTVDLMVAFKGV